MLAQFRFAARTAPALLLLALAMPSHAQSRDERAAIDFALERGRLLFGLDRAAWVATDDFVARQPDYANQGVRGYVVERDGNGFAVTFFGGAEGSPVAYYRGRVANHRVVSRELYPAAARPALSAAQRRLVAARQAAASATRRRPCGSAPFNTAVIPPATPDAPIDVYLLTPQMRDREYPFGGHYRLTVDADGSVGGERAFTNSCITMPAPPDAAAIFITHLLDPVPTEIHVFTALTGRMPVIVGVDGRVYEVTGERIRQIRSRRRR